jgi:hypothetical protein
MYSKFHYEPRQLIGYRREDPGIAIQFPEGTVDGGRGVRFVPFFKTSIPAVEFTQFPVYWTVELLPRR